MNFETLKRSHLKRNIIIGAVVVLVISAVVLNFTKAKYRLTQSIPLVNGTINYTPYDFKMVAMYQESDNGEYTEIEQMPNSNFVINKEKSYCTLDNINKENNIKLYTNNNGEHVIYGLKKNSKCYLYFDNRTCPLGENLCNTILSNKKISTRTEFDTIMTTDTTDIIYQTNENNKKSYYFAGNPTNNWIQFAGFYWRIIRINNDGSIRMIYQGTSAYTNGVNTQIGKSTFNNLSDNNMYVGYMYANNELHGLVNDSTIKQVLDNWYKSNIYGTKYEQFINIEAGFCGDRAITVGTGIGTNQTWYEPNNRIINLDTPSLECNSEDLYTVKQAQTGNKALTYPIGLITVDEINFAGGAYYQINESFYLYTGEYYWTMSPRNFTDVAKVFVLANGGGINTLKEGTNINIGVRPVINLKADVTITSGNGTSTNPYVIAT